MIKKFLPVINFFFILIIGLGMLPFLRSSITGLQGDVASRQKEIIKAVEALTQKQKQLEQEDIEINKKIEEQIAAQTKKAAKKKDNQDKNKLIDPTKISSGSKNNLTLSAIVATGGESYCLINDTILRQGDEISPYKVVLITQDYVLLTDEDENNFKLQLN